MIKLFALAAFLAAAANGYLNHGPAFLANSPAPYYGHYAGNPVSAVPQPADFWKSSAAPGAIPAYVKSPSYETVEKPQVQLTKAVYATYNPTVTNLPANHEAAAVSIGSPAARHYAPATAYPLPLPRSIFAPAAPPSHRYLQVGYPRAQGLPRMPYAPDHIAHLNYPW